MYSCLGHNWQMVQFSLRHGQHSVEIVVDAYTVDKQYGCCCDRNKQLYNCCTDRVEKLYNGCCNRVGIVQLPLKRVLYAIFI